MPGNWYVAHRYDGSCSLQIFVWPPGSRTKIHDHPSWGAFCCVVGALFEERYERLDDTSRPEFARLSKLWEWGREVGAAVVVPYEGAIHRVGNPPCTFAAPGLET